MVLQDRSALEPSLTLVERLGGHVAVGNDTMMICHSYVCKVYSNIL